MTFEHPKYKLMPAYLAACLLLSTFCLGQSGADSNKPQEIKPGQPLSREIKGGESHNYQIKLKTNEFLRVVVDQQGVDVVVRLFAPDGKLVAERDRPNGKNGEESLSAEASAAGVYRVEIAALEKDAPAGKYNITSDGPRKPTAADKRRIAAETAFQEGMKLRATQTEESWRKALAQYEAALSAWQELKDDYAGTLAFSTMAFTESALGNYEQATKLFARALQKVDLVKSAPLAKEIRTNLARNYFSEGEKLLREATAESKRTAAEKFRTASDLYREIEDMKGEAWSLIALGRIAYETNERTEASKYFEKAANLCRVTGDKLGEGVSLGTLGRIFADLGDKRQALKFYGESLPLFQAIGDKKRVNTTLNNMGSAYSELGYKEQSLKFYSDALILIRESGDKKAEAQTLNNIGENHNSIGETQKALEIFQIALQLFNQIGDKNGEGIVLANIGYIYHQLGQKEKAMGFYTPALALFRQLGNKNQEGAVLSTLGVNLTESGETEKALEFFNQAIPLLRETGNKRAESITLSNIGSLYLILGDKEKGLEFYTQGLRIIRTTGNKREEAIQLTDLGAIYYGSGENQKAFECLQDALLLSRAVGDKNNQARTLDHLGYYWFRIGNRRLAVFHGKQSVNKYQELRRAIQGLDKDTQKTYLKSIEPTYRRLADILIAEGRIAESEQVLAMLKEEEFFAYLRRDETVANELLQTLSLTEDEKAAFKRYEELADSITKLGSESAALQAEAKGYPVGKFPKQARLDEIEGQIADANRVFAAFLDSLAEKFTNKQTGQADARVELVSNTQALLKELKQPRTVIISTIAAEDRLNLIVTTADVQRAHTVEIKAEELNKLVLSFREAVRDPKVDPREAGKKLFDKLFPASLQKDLDGIKADTIIWSLDGTLRYVPMSALWNGKQYLAERYATGVITLASRDNLDDDPTARAKWRALGVGVSKPFETFSALPAVPEELCTVVNDPQAAARCAGGRRGVVDGVNLLDDQFTLPTFKSSLGRFPIVHIASHFSLNPGNEKDSFLLLGGKSEAERKLTLEAVRNTMKTGFIGVELLTLSACNTAMTAGNKSNGVEVEGFGALAQKAGAKAVLATLWAVADPSTRDLMSEFYHTLETETKQGKAEALRQAQLTLMQGKYKPGETPEWRRGAKPVGPTAGIPFKPDERAPYAHPYYWAPFVLIGNWR